MSNAIMEYDLVRNIYFLDPLDVESLDEFVGVHGCINCVVVDQA